MSQILPLFFPIVWNSGSLLVFTAVELGNASGWVSNECWEAELKGDDEYALDNCFSFFHASLDRITCLSSVIDSVSETFWEFGWEETSVFLSPMCRAYQRRRKPDTWTFCYYYWKHFSLRALLYWWISSLKSPLSNIVVSPSFHAFCRHAYQVHPPCSAITWTCLCQLNSLIQLFMG